MSFKTFLDKWKSHHISVPQIKLFLFNYYFKSGLFQFSAFPVTVQNVGGRVQLMVLWLLIYLSIIS